MNLKFGKIVAFMSAVLFVSGSIAGCNGTRVGGPNKSDSNTDGRSRDALTADEIIANMRKVYSSAQSYRDEAILSLSYRLQGRFLEEPHQWAVEFQRPQQLRARIYNSRMHCDGEKMACFVYDFGSGNLGNQWQVHNAGANLPLGRFFQDGICRHYLTGQTDLPVDRENPKVAEMFFPPTIGLLTGQAQIDWLGRSSFVRKPDRSADSRVFHAIDARCDGMVFELLIDAKSFLLNEIRYPVQALDGRLLTSPDVENLEIVARFQGASSPAVFKSRHFELEIPPESILVSHFVPVPEVFPSPAIGKSISPMGLIDMRGDPINQADWTGKVMLLAWSSDGLLDESWSNVFEQLASELSVREYQIATVNVVPQAVPGEASLNDAISRIRPQKVMANYVDPGFEGGKVLGVDEWPFYAVIDRQGILQYVYANQREAPDVQDVRRILLRVRSGDDVAAEMRGEYEKFLDEYQVRLASAILADGGNTVKSSVFAELRLPVNVAIQEIWNVKELVQPGNMELLESGSDHLLVVDGWRTLVKLDADGNVIARDEIPLPPRESINVLRKSMTSDLFVVYSIAGRHVHIVDRENKVLFRVFDSKGSDRVRDSRLADLNGDGIDELYVSWTGERGTEVYRPEMKDAQLQVFFETGWRDSAVVSDQANSQKLIVCDQDSLLKLVSVDGDGKAILSAVSTGIDSAVRVRTAITSNGTPSTCVVGTDSRGEWKAALLDSQLRQTAIFPIGPQQFETQIEPIAFGNPPGTQPGIWSLAGSDGSVTIISADGTLIDRWNTGRIIDGISMFTITDSLAVALSGEQGVRAWELTLPVAK